MKKIGYIFLFIILALVVWTVARWLLDIASPSKKEFVTNKQAFENLVEKLDYDKQIFHIEQDERGDVRLINMERVVVKDNYYVSDNEKTYSITSINEYLKLMNSLNFYSINGGNGSAVFLKKGRDNNYYGYGYERSTTSKSVYDKKFIEEKLDDHWYIIAIFK